MAQYRVTSPDGQTYNVTGPEGASNERVLSQIKAYSGGAPSSPAPAKPIAEATAASEGSMTDFLAGNINIGISRALGLPVDTAENLYNLAKAGVGTATGRPQDFPLVQGTPGGSKSIEGVMRKTGMVRPGAEPTSKLGEYGAQALQMGGAAMMPASRFQPGRIAPPPTGMLGRLGQAAGETAQYAAPRFKAGAVSGLAAQAATDIGGPEFGPVGALLPGTKGAISPASKTETAAKGRQAERFAKAKGMGIPVPPRQMKLDKPGLQAEAQVTKELGFPEGTELSSENLQNFRNAHWKDYEAVIKSSALKAGVQPTKAFQATLQEIGGEIDKARSNLPETFKSMKPVMRLLGEYGYAPPMGKTSFPPRSKPIPPDVAMRAIKKLRADAGTNLSSDKPEQVELGHVQRKLAGAVEDLIEENLTTGKADPNLMQSFRSARTAIAKSHDVESSLDPGTRKFSPERLSRLMGEGRPMTGGMRDVAEVAGEFPGAMKGKPEGEYFTQRVTPMAVTHPEAIGAHWAARLTDPIKTSRPYQSMFVDPGNKLSPDQGQYVRNMLAAIQAQSRGIPEPPEGRQFGGPIAPGKPYMVGEAGPEVVVPKQPAMVLAGDPMGIAAKNRYKEATGASIDSSEPTGQVERTSQGVIPPPPNVAGLAALLVKTGRARNMQEALLQAQSMLAQRR
jgi:hypothetical protein